jgi:hypothetical protein
MRVAFRDFANGTAVNRPRMRYLAQHPDPERKYLANVHVGAVPSFGIACVRAGSQIIKPPSATNVRRLYENPQPFNWAPFQVRSATVQHRRHGGVNGRGKGRGQGL